MSTKLEKLRNKAYKIGGNAIENYKDAVLDLMRWPDLRKKILNDLEKALNSYDERYGE